MDECLRRVSLVTAFAWKDAYDTPHNGLKWWGYHPIHPLPNALLNASLIGQDIMMASGTSTTCINTSTSRQLT